MRGSIDNSRSPEKQRQLYRAFYEKALAVGGVFC